MNAKHCSLVPWLCIAAASCLMSAPAWAAITCGASASGVVFGVYPQASPTPLDSTGLITLTCTKSPGPDNTLTYSIALSAGASGSYAARTMTSGASTLSYNLYTDLARTLIWGNGIGGAQTVNGSVQGLSGSAATIFNFTIYGRVPALQNVNPGSYTDSIVVTVTY